jgi:hypothetical protein
MLIQAEGIGCHTEDKDALWQYDRSPVQRQPQTLTFIPWFSWANRVKGKCGFGWMKRKQNHNLRQYIIHFMSSALPGSFLSPIKDNCDLNLGIVFLSICLYTIEWDTILVLFH